MNDPNQLRSKAEAILGPNEAIQAAGIFALQDGYLALTVGGVIGGTVGGLAGGAGQVLGDVAGMHAAREMRAASQGVSERMLVAVTSTHIHILDWVTGSGPTRLLRSFDRGTTTVEIKKFGLSRHIHLHDTVADQSLALTGTTVGISAEAKGDKGVLAALA